MAFFKNYFEKVIEIAKFFRSYSMKASYFKHLENHITARHIPGWRARLGEGEQIVGSAHGTR